MNKPNSLIEPDMHMKLAQETFNAVWDLLAKRIEMIMKP